jgi:hypothetical protein
VNIDATFGNRRRTLDLLHFFHQGRDEGLVFQINAAEFESKVLRSRLQRQCHLLSCMKRCAGDGG